MNTKYLDKTAEARKQTAAVWVFRITSDDNPMTAEEHDRFDEWLSADPLNEQTFSKLYWIWEMAGDAVQDRAAIGIEFPTHVEKTSVGKINRSSFFLPIAAMLLVALGIAGWFVLERGLIRQPTAITRTGELQSNKFPDGSVAYLNTRTRLQWLGGAASRRVALYEGEALFDVTNDPARPFRVILDHSEIEVLGTKFNVYRKGPESVVVSVLEGKIRVRYGDPVKTVELSANERMKYSLEGAVVLQKANTAKDVLWLERTVAFDEAPIVDVLDEFRRYTDANIVVRDARVDSERIGGTFYLRKIPEALDEIQRRTRVRVTRENNNFILDYCAEGCAEGEGE